MHNATEKQQSTLNFIIMLLLFTLIVLLLSSFFKLISEIFAFTLQSLSYARDKNLWFVI